MLYHYIFSHKDYIFLLLVRVAFMNLKETIRIPLLGCKNLSKYAELQYVRLEMAGPG